MYSVTDEENAVVTSFMSLFDTFRFRQFFHIERGALLGWMYQN